MIAMNKRTILRNIPLVCYILSLLMLAFSMAGSFGGNETDRITEKIQEKLAARMEILDQHIVKVLETGTGEWPEAGEVPNDMVIYRYVNDSLQSWSNQFNIINDDISSKLVFHRITSMKNSIISPLSQIGENVSYLNIGPKWYVAKSVTGANNDKILAGIEIKNTLLDDIMRNENGVNAALGVPAGYTVMPLSYSGGAEISLDGSPIFKIIAETGKSTGLLDNNILKWISLYLFAIATLLLLATRRKFKVYIVVVVVMTALMATTYFWAQRINESMQLFSPTIYADGPYLNSLGILILVNGFITMIFMATYMMRERFIALIRCSRGRKWMLPGFGAITLLSIAAIFIYSHITLKSIILNSSISLELYRANPTVTYTIAVYLSYICLLFCIMLQIQTLSPVTGKLFRFRYDVMTTKGFVAFAVVCSLYFTLTSSILGFSKEQDRAMVWSNRLAVDRNLALEIQLRSAEESIANDQLISALAMLDNTAGMLQNRISEYYLSRVRKDNIISVNIFKEDDRNGIDFFNSVLRSGTPISDGSRFMFMTDGNGRSRYSGTFFFWSQENGLIRMLLTVEPHSNREDRGYYSILGRFSKPGEINIPQYYSYAKYIDDRLVFYKGNYPYPTVSHHIDKSEMEASGSTVMRLKNHIHFLSMVSDNEMIVISRKQRNPITYFTSFSYLALLITAGLSFFVKKKKAKKIFKRNYFRTKINMILFISSTLILLSMTIVSIVFVYKRNEDNMLNLMSSKISTVQALTETKIRHAGSWKELTAQETVGILENIANTTKSDITLYTPEGKVFHSTTPEVFEKQILGSRVNEDAYRNIRYLNQRFFIHREKMAGYSYWMLYAPVFNEDRQMLAIISTPYTERSYDFRREAVSHAALIINLFLLLLIGSLLFSTREVNQMFAPLVEMGRKMNTADIHNLEYIIYKREDEISSLVDAYNRMVQDLSESTQKLAAAERDKAWSEMARQVAHEIKNPLTPIKLEIQRLIRLKQKGNPAWEERFDKVSDVVLEHIDILTDTANEFSTFAKLYSEDPVLIDLDSTLQEQLLIFDNKENIDISYIGMKDSFVMAPKPQLIRVFVNLITNAIQAVEIQQKDAAEKGEETPDGRIVICLRNSMREGFYDIVVDDNGPGVKEENLSRLFTPNFTTKSGGTGLGLAICRNIITKCEGDISYQKSFALGGASFTVTLPKHTV